MTLGVPLSTVRTGSHKAGIETASRRQWREPQSQSGRRGRRSNGRRPVASPGRELDKLKPGDEVDFVRVESQTKIVRVKTIAPPTCRSAAAR